MRKVVLNISDNTYEKFCLEAIHEQKSVIDIIKERILSKPFHPEVEGAFDAWMNQEFEKIMKD